MLSTPITLNEQLTELVYLNQRLGSPLDEGEESEVVSRMAELVQSLKNTPARNKFDLYARIGFVIKGVDGDHGWHLAGTPLKQCLEQVQRDILFVIG